jgi:hypothetical protein
MSGANNKALVEKSMGKNYGVPMLEGAAASTAKYADTMSICEDIVGGLRLLITADCLPLRKTTASRNRFCVNETGRI